MSCSVHWFNRYLLNRFSFVADHFQYLASIGPITLFAAAAARLAGWIVAQGAAQGAAEGGAR